MDARCPLCTSVFQTERTGVQFCPNCGQQVNVADVTGAAPPPPSGPGPGPVFTPPGGPGYTPPPSPPPPPSSFGKGPTPWERRSELGFFPAFFQTMKETLFDPVSFFSRAEPSKRVWDAILYSWIIYAFCQLVFELPLRLLGVGGVGETTPKDLDQLPPQMREFVEKMTSMAKEQQSAGAAIGVIVGAIVFYPLLLLIGTAIVHLFCLMFGAAKNGFAATLRSFCYAASPMLFGFWLFSCIALPYSLVLTIIGVAYMQETSGGRAAGAVLTPFVVFCCCCCGLAFLAGMSMAGAAANLK